MKNNYPLKNVLLVQGLYILAILLWIIALACFFAYGQTVYESIGAADKSLLFWYLPILFIGIFAAQAGFACVAIGGHKSRKME